MTDGNGYCPASDSRVQQMIAVRVGILRRHRERKDRPRLTDEELPSGYSYCQRCHQPVFTPPEDRTEGKTPQYCKDCQLLEPIPAG